MADRVHQLKTWPAEFGAILSGVKRVVLRRDDRGYQVGSRSRYTSAASMLGGQFGLAPGWVALSLSEAPAGGDG